jgi:hypothetical protein
LLPDIEENLRTLSDYRIAHFLCKISTLASKKFLTVKGNNNDALDQGEGEAKDVSPSKISAAAKTDKA